MSQVLTGSQGVMGGLPYFLISDLAQVPLLLMAHVWAPDSSAEQSIFYPSLAPAPGFYCSFMQTKCAEVGKSQVCFRPMNFLVFRAIMCQGVEEI